MISPSWQIAELPHNSHLGTATGWLCQRFSGAQDDPELQRDVWRESVMQRSLQDLDVSSVTVLQNITQCGGQIGYFRHQAHLQQPQESEVNFVPVF